LSNAAHGFHQPGNAPVAYSYGNADGDSANRTAGTHEEGERDGEEHAYWSNEGVGNLNVPLHGQTGNVETSAPQVFDVAVQLGNSSEMPGELRD